MIQVNGRDVELSEPTNVERLLARLGGPRFVAVEVNGHVVPRARHADVELSEGDLVELVTLVGGG